VISRDRGLVIASSVLKNTHRDRIEGRRDVRNVRNVVCAKMNVNYCCRQEVRGMSSFTTLKFIGASASSLRKGCFAVRLCPPNHIFCAARPVTEVQTVRLD
jgi:hypothetical protein